MNSAKLNFNIIDQSYSTNDAVNGISGFVGVFKRGPIGKASDVFSSFAQFSKVYGGLIPTSDDPLIVKRMLDKGSKVRVSGVRHFTDITNPTATDSVVASNLATKVYTLSIALIAGTTATYTVDGVAVNQLFTTDSITTLKALAVKILAAFPTKVDYVYVASGTVIQITLLTGVAAFTATGTGAPTIASTTLTGFRDSLGNELFQLVPKYPGQDYNNLRVSVKAPSNGQANYFDVSIEFTSEPNYSPEVYPNITIPGSPNIPNSNYLANIVMGSNLVNVVYRDLSALVSPINPQVNYSRYALGSDGSAPVDTDYIGDAGGKNGLHGFDAISDIYAIGSNNQNDAMAIGGAAYAAARGDLQYFHHFNNSYTTAAQIIANKTALNINTPYIEFWTGGLVVIDPLSNVQKNLSAIGDILANAAISEANHGPYRSFAGTKRGLVFNAIGVVNNFGSPGDLTSLDLLANYQINAVVNVDSQIALSGNFSGQLATSHMSFNNVVRLIIFMQRSLRPLLKTFIEDPNDIPTWKNIYLSGKPFMDGLINPRRAIFDYQWQGDQFVSTIADIKINNATDIGLGKYKIALYVKDITSLQTFSFNIIITDASIAFTTSPISN